MTLFLPEIMQNCFSMPMVGGSLISLLVLASCASEHALPQFKPLIGGLDESLVPASARVALIHAKEDFQCVRQGRAPLYARPAGIVPGTRSRVFEGDGYRLTAVDSDYSNVHLHGLEIVIDPSITHAQAYHYDEIQRTNEAPQS
jgi:hypothetical protein